MKQILNVFQVAFISLLFVTVGICEEKGEIKDSISQYTFTDHIQADSINQLDPDRGFLLANDKEPEKGIKGVSIVALKTSSKIFKSIEIGGSIGAAFKNPEAKINLVATW